MNGNGKNIVLDIDATLVHTHGDMDDFKMLNVYGNEEQLDMRKKVYNMRIIDVSDVPGEGEVTDASICFLSKNSLFSFSTMMIVKEMRII